MFYLPPLPHPPPPKKKKKKQKLAILFLVLFIIVIQNKNSSFHLLLWIPGGLPSCFKPKNLKATTWSIQKLRNNYQDWCLLGSGGTTVSVFPILRSVRSTHVCCQHINLGITYLRAFVGGQRFRGPSGLSCSEIHIPVYLLVSRWRSVVVSQEPRRWVSPGVRHWRGQSPMWTRSLECLREGVTIWKFGLDSNE